MTALFSIILLVACQVQDKAAASDVNLTPVPTNATAMETNPLSIKEQVAKAQFVFDTRSTSEFNSGHLAHAVQIEYTEIADRIAEFVLDKNAVIYVYCASGDRSGRAQKSLIEKGYVNVINAGGYFSLK